MRWHKKVVRAVNRTRNTVLGDRIRVADNTLTRIVGLLGERELPPGDGLLIDPSQGVHTWGMMFPIDVLVLDHDWSAIGLRRRMGPFRITRMFWKAAMVLELPSGTLEATSTSVGDAIEFSAVQGREAAGRGVVDDVSASHVSKPGLLMSGMGGAGLQPCMRTERGSGRLQPLRYILSDRKQCTSGAKAQSASAFNCRPEGLLHPCAKPSQGATA